MKDLGRGRRNVSFGELPDRGGFVDKSGPKRVGDGGSWGIT